MSTADALSLADNTIVSLRALASPSSSPGKESPYALLADALTESGVGTITQQDGTFIYVSQSAATPGVHLVVNGVVSGPRIISLAVRVDGAAQDFTIFSSVPPLPGSDPSEETYAFDFDSMEGFAAALHNAPDSARLSGILYLSVGDNGTELSGNGVGYQDDLVTVTISNLVISAVPGERDLGNLVLHAQVTGVLGLAGTVDINTTAADRGQVPVLIKGGFDPSASPAPSPPANPGASPTGTDTGSGVAS